MENDLPPSDCVSRADGFIELCSKNRLPHVVVQQAVEKWGKIYRLKNRYFFEKANTAIRRMDYVHYSRAQRDGSIVVASVGGVKDTVYTAKGDVAAIRISIGQNGHSIVEDVYFTREALAGAFDHGFMVDRTHAFMIEDGDFRYQIIDVALKAVRQWIPHGLNGVLVYEDASDTAFEVVRSGIVTGKVKASTTVTTVLASGTLTDQERRFAAAHGDFAAIIRLAPEKYRAVEAAE